MSDNNQQNYPTASGNTVAAHELVTGKFPVRSKTPTDEQITEFERLIHVACAATMRFKAHPSFENATERRNAVAMAAAHQANIFEGEGVAA